MYEKLRYASPRLAIAMCSFRDGMGYCSNLFVVNERRGEILEIQHLGQEWPEPKEVSQAACPICQILPRDCAFQEIVGLLPPSFTWFGSSHSQPGKAMLRSSCPVESRFNLAEFWCQIPAQSALQPLTSHRYTRKVTRASQHTHTHHQPYCCGLMGVSKLNFLGSFLQSSQVYTSFTLRCLHQAMLSLISFYLHYT